MTIKVLPATARAVMPIPAMLNLSPAHGTSIASLALTISNDAGQLVVALVLVPSVLLMIAAALIANADVLLAGF